MGDEDAVHSAALRGAFITLLLILIGCARMAPQLITPARAHAATHPSADPVPTASEPRRNTDDGDVDLYGNDVTAAVAKYQLDTDGSLYELHSPQTQLPKLGPPKS